MIRSILFFLLGLSFNTQLISQCLNTVSDSNNIGGYFDGANGLNSWYTGGGDGTFSLDNSDFFFDTIGSSDAGSLKVVVSGTDDYTNNNVRIMTKNSVSSGCLFDYSTNDSWNVSFYIKGELGDELDFNIVKNGAEGSSLSSASYTIRYKGWHYMRLKMSTPTASENGAGRFRINFKSTGTYRLDNVVLEKETASTPFNIWYVGDGTNGSSTSSGGNGSFNNPYQNINDAILLNTNWLPGDLIYVRTGTYKNDNWDGSNETWGEDPQTSDALTDNNEPYLKIDRYTNYDSSGNGSANSGSKLLVDKNGSIDRPIVIRNYVDNNGTHDTPKILFDGKAGFQFGSGSGYNNATGGVSGNHNHSWIVTFMEVAGFEIQGPNQEITYSEASSNRTNAINLRTASSSNTTAIRNMYHGRGIVVWGGYYLNIHNNSVYDCPNSGIRFNNSDYVRVSNNTVYNNTWWSYNGESGIVIAQSRNRDDDDSSSKIKMRITNNITYGNINKIVYFNPQYDCETGGSYDPNKDSYACGGRNKIVDGSGCYITRNAYDSDDVSGSNPNYGIHGDYNGGFLFANNVSYANGMNGVVVHKTDDAKVYNNTVYENGQVPSEADSDWVSAGNHTYVDNEGSSSSWKTPLAEGRQNYSGIVVHSSNDAKLFNNISIAKNANDRAYVNYVENGWSTSGVDFGTNENLARPHYKLALESDGNGGTNLTSTITYTSCSSGSSASVILNEGNTKYVCSSTTPSISSGSIDATISLSLTGGNQSLASSNFIGSMPQFEDATNNTLANRDYNLSISWSDAIDAVNSSYAPEDDVLGTYRPQGQNYDIGAYELRNSWTGSTNTDWNTSTNWSNGIVPTSGRSPVISNVTNQPVISNLNVNLKDITINSGAELTINKDASLFLSGDFINNSGTVNLNSDSNEFSSLIIKGTSTGNIIYNRYVNSVGTDKWDLIGSPVDGLSISSFATTNTSPLATGGGSESNQYAIGYFDNSQNSLDAAWTNYTTSTIGSIGDFDIGKGYQMGTDSGATMAFEGTISTSNESKSIINNSGSSGYRWNLIANPYPSFLSANDDTSNGSNNFLTVNTSVIDGNYLGIYGYNDDGAGYTSYGQDYNDNDTPVYIAPGQGFMIAANSSNSADIDFTVAMQTTTGTDDFISGDIEVPLKIILHIYNDDLFIEDTHIKFQYDKSLGLDPGYDLGNFYQDAGITTRLVEGDEGVNFERQQLPIEALDNTIIPLVINQAAGQEFKVNLHTSTIYDSNVYLEDSEEGTFTNLYEGDFAMTPTSDLSGAGRFFIHITANTMSNEDVPTSMLNAYKEVNNNYITIEGLATQSNNINVSLYNILGRKVLDTTLSNNMNTQTLSTLGMASGIHVIELESGNNRLTKKLIIQ
ncbi:MAG: T9SS type A sorting domain-containing protein [Flavobacteriaceae bacterium]|nr:T9SS type A sorting domain-containing protein [Flavobacteriaceae bacterium]